MRSDDRGSAVFTLSGRIEADQVTELQRLFEAEARPLVLDLDEIELVDREALKFLARCEAEGFTLKNCPAYIRAWMAGERDGQ